jgi:hypothetical protein
MFVSWMKLLLSWRAKANFSDRLRVLQESWQAANEVGKRQMTEASRGDFSG